MNCLVLWCNNKGKIPGINYFCLTKKRHDAWMQALGRNPIAEHLRENNVICSKHFSPEDICREGKRIKLRPNAVPKLYLRKNDYIIEQGSSRVLQEIPQNVPTSSEDTAQEIAGSMDDMEILFIDNKENTPEVTIFSTLKTAESSPISFTTSTTDSSGSLKRSREDISTDSEGNKGEIKKARQEIKIRHNYSASPSNLLRQLKDANVRKTLAQKKLKMMKVKVGRLKKRVTSLKQVLWNVKKKNLLSENGIQFMEKTITGVPLSILKRTIEVKKKKSQGKQYKHTFEAE